MDSTLEILKRLSDHNVEFVVVGGLAGVVHGSALVTEDVDVCAPLSLENLRRLLAALTNARPRHRMNPVHPPVPDAPERLVGYKNLYLLTDLGQIDFVSEITGVGDYAEVVRHTILVELGGIACRVLNLDALIQSKRAMGRTKDIQAAVELEAIRQRMAAGDR